MKTLVCVFNYPKAAPIVERHWPWYKRAGCDIFGIGTDGGGCWWPESDPQFIGRADIGKDSYVNGDHLPWKVVRTLNLLCRNFQEYDAFCITEPDAIFVRELPVPYPEGLIATVACGPQAGFHGSRCLHGPWFMTKPVARQMVIYGERMIRAGLIEQGFPDYFMGLMVDLYDILLIKDETFSVNLIDRPEYVAAARQAIEQGCFYVHGIKTAEQLTAVTQGLIDANT